jgi:TctA family transporter
MFAGLADLGHAWLGFLNPTSLALGLGGALLGIIVGVLPGLSATLVIALLTTLTVKLQANDAILVLICSYVGALYGGSRTAILLNIPGTAANAASCADGFALAQRGEAGRAIGIATSGAFMGTLFGVLCLATFTPTLAEFALSFGAYEFFWLALFGVAMSGSIVGNDPLKGWLMGALGLFVAQVGQEGLYAYDRFTFGWDELAGGIALIPALVGAFANASRLFDIYAMLAVGIGAFFLRRRGYQMAPFVLGLVLGPLLDKSLRRGLVLSDGSVAPFFTRPICTAFAIVTIFTILLYIPAFKALVGKVTGGIAGGVRGLLPRRS